MRRTGAHHSIALPSATTEVKSRAQVTVNQEVMSLGYVLLPNTIKL